MWKIKNPCNGDHIRVNRGFYYHHGIYASDECVYQFASPEGSEISPETAVVGITTLDKFLKGGIVEVREYSDDELKEKRNPEEIIKYAKEHLGEMGYNLISNNCEHFANRCVFGKSMSTQVDDIFEKIMGAFSK